VSEKKKLLIQLDTDARPSLFDRVVAIDAGADDVLSYSGITPESVRDLVYGAIFTRGVRELQRTAMFIGGSDLRLGEKVLEAVLKAFLGKLRVSVLLDSSGANTTASAAVLLVRQHVSLSGAPALVLGGTGPVGMRVARILAKEGAKVRIGSRMLERARAACEAVRERSGSEPVPVVAADAPSLTRALADVKVVIAAGGSGVTLLPREVFAATSGIEVAVDLNAVPPAGIEAIEMQDSGANRGGVLCYGAIGVGGTKMKIHRAALASLFDANDRTLDVEAVYAVGKELLAKP
jgi:hypothetical protein